VVYIYYVGVIGSSDCNDVVKRMAVQVGEELARKGAVILCGGRGGVMEGVAKGAAGRGGTVIGILPGCQRQEGNKYLTYTLPTGLGDARNAVIARSADALIAISGGTGTLSEIGLALKMGKTVIGLHSWDIKPPTSHDYCFITASHPEQAVRLALEACTTRS
jgi:hypothetical protein